jgi:putative transposase
MAREKGVKLQRLSLRRRPTINQRSLLASGFSLKGTQVNLAKIGLVSPIRSRELPSKPSSVTVIKDCANRYFLSFVVDVEPQDLEPINPSLGIDLGLKTFATLSDGTQVKSPDYSKSERKIRKLQRRLARQQKDSKRRQSILDFRF